MLRSLDRSKKLNRAQHTSLLPIFTIPQATGPRARASDQKLLQPPSLINMPSHLASIGFPAEPDQIFPIVDQIFLTGIRYLKAGADYMSWNSGRGPEAWLHLRGNNFLTLIPHFLGPSRVRCQITTEVVREKTSSLEAAFHAWVNSNAEGKGGDYPIVFDSPDYYNGPPLGFPQSVKIQFALFPEQVGIFKNERAFNEAQTDRTTKYSSQSLISTGLIGESPPRSEIFACGVVRNVTLQTNSLTRIPFLAIQFETGGGRFDAPFPNAGDFRDINVGNILAGTFWVSGRILCDASPLQKI